MWATHVLATTAGGRGLIDIVSAYEAQHHVGPCETGWLQINNTRSIAYQRPGQEETELRSSRSWELSIWFDLKIVLMAIARVSYDPRLF